MPRPNKKDGPKSSALAIRFSTDTRRMMREFVDMSGVTQSQLFELVCNAALKAIKEQEYRIMLPLKFKLDRDS